MLLAENTHQKSLTPEAIWVIKSLKVFFVENIKTTRRFISSLKEGIVIDELQFFEINQDTGFEEVYNFLQETEGDFGVISEAGCAGVADPGALVVEVAHQLGIKVNPLVGPNSILLAFMGIYQSKKRSGLKNCDRLKKRLLKRNKLRFLWRHPIVIFSC